ncbi:unnamed protein product [Penicillium manginii]
MVRAFPQGFNYPIPRGWPVSSAEEPRDVITFPWKSVDERHRGKYPGFRIVTRALAQQKNNVVELVLDARQIDTGTNCFRRLDLSLMFGGRRSAIENWKTFRDGRLRKTLSEMIDLEEFTFYTAGLENCYEGKTPPIDSNTVSPERIFPVERWFKLRHFQGLHYRAL